MNEVSTQSRLLTHNLGLSAYDSNTTDIDTFVRTSGHLQDLSGTDASMYHSQIYNTMGLSAGAGSKA